MVKFQHGDAAKVSLGLRAGIPHSTKDIPHSTKQKDNEWRPKGAASCLDFRQRDNGHTDTGIRQPHLPWYSGWPGRSLALWWAGCIFVGGSESVRCTPKMFIFLPPADAAQSALPPKSRNQYNAQSILGTFSDASSNMRSKGSKSVQGSNKTFILLPRMSGVQSALPPDRHFDTRVDVAMAFVEQKGAK